MEDEEDDRLRRWPVSGGVERERDRVVGSERSGLGPLCGLSGVNMGWLGASVGVVGGVERPEALLVLEKILMLAEGTALEEERKIPLKLRRRGDLGDAVLFEGKGKMLFGVDGHVFGCVGAVWGLGSKEEALPGLAPDADLTGLAEWVARSPLLEELLASDCGKVNAPMSGMLIRRLFLLFGIFLERSLLDSITVLPILAFDTDRTLMIK